jgi:MFS family permease
VPILAGLAAVGTLVTIIPAAKLSDRIGRKRVIYGSCAIGAVGMTLVALATSFPVAAIGSVIYGLSAGIFLAVDWALMTDIIPKASTGRYMGLSNVATASSGVLAIAIGGTLMDVVGGADGPRAALWMAVVLFGIGALLLMPVDERRREDLVPIGVPEPEPVPA